MLVFESNHSCSRVNKHLSPLGLPASSSDSYFRFTHTVLYCVVSTAEFFCFLFPALSFLDISQEQGKRTWSHPTTKESQTLVDYILVCHTLYVRDELRKSLKFSWWISPLGERLLYFYTSLQFIDHTCLSHNMAFLATDSLHFVAFTVVMI